MLQFIGWENLDQNRHHVGMVTTAGILVDNRPTTADVRKVCKRDVPFCGRTVVVTDIDGNIVEERPLAMVA